MLFYRPINDVQGLTRETIIALAADIETRIWRSALLERYSLPPEHPRSSTTDDVECFFSILRDTVGKNFTLKQVIIRQYRDGLPLKSLLIIYRFIMGGGKFVSSL